jgi:hypothetical protein
MNKTLAELQEEGWLTSVECARRLDTSHSHVGRQMDHAKVRVLEIRYPKSRPRRLYWHEDVQKLINKKKRAMTPVPRIAKDGPKMAVVAAFVKTKTPQPSADSPQLPVLSPQPPADDPQLPVLSSQSSASNPKWVPIVMQLLTERISKVEEKVDGLAKVVAELQGNVQSSLEHLTDTFKKVLSGADLKISDVDLSEALDGLTIDPTFGWVEEEN